MTEEQLTVGSRAQVWHGTAKHTSGGLKKKDLMMHNGRIVSRRAHEIAKKTYKKRFGDKMAAPFGSKKHGRTRKHRK
jgi:hypothetical protein